MTIPFSPSPDSATPEIGQADGFVVGAAFSALNNRTEGNVKSQLAAQMQNDNTWSALWDVFFGFIKAPFEWVWAAMKRLFPFIDWQALEDFDFWESAAWVIDQLEQVPFVGDIVRWITGATTGTWETLQLWFENVRMFFAHINFFADDFDLLAAAEDFIDFILFPVGKLADMVGLGELGDWIRQVGSAITGWTSASLEGTVATLTAWFDNVWSFLGNLNFLDGNFDLLAAAEDFIDFILFPVNKLASMFDIDQIQGWLREIGGALTGWISGSVEGTIATLTTWFGNLRTFFANLNFLDGDFDLIAAAEDFIDFILFPVGKLADVAGLAELGDWIRSLGGAITGWTSDSIAGTIATLTEWFDNVWSFFGNLNFFDGNFDLLAAAEDFIDFILFPVGKIASMLNLQEIWDWLTQFLEDLFAGPANFIGNIANVLMDGINSVGDFLTKTWQSFTGQSGANKTVNDVALAATAVTATTNTASTNASNALTNAATAQGTADGAAASAGTANTNLQTTWNELVNAFDGTTTATGRTPTNVRNRGAAVRTSAVTGETNAYTALVNAATADGKAVVAQSAAATADGKAVAAQSAAATADTKAVAAQTNLTAIAQSSNKVISPTFEDSSIVRSRLNSTGGTYEYSTTAPYVGTKCFKVTSTTSELVYHGFYLQPIQGQTRYYGTPGDVIHASIMLKAAAGNNNSTYHSWRLYMTFWGAGGAAVSNPSYEINTGPMAANPDVWLPMELTATFPEGAYNFQVYVMAPIAPASNVYYFDAAVVREETTARVALTDAGAAQAQAITATTNAATAQGQADTATTAAATADGKAVAAQGAAATADGKAVVAQSAAATADSKAVTAQSSANLVQSKFSTYLAGGQNMLPNPSYEITAYSTGGYSTEYSTAESYYGIRSCKINGTGAVQYPAIGGSERIKVVPGQVFAYEFWAYGDDANTYSSGSTIVLAFGLWCYNNTNVYQANVRGSITLDQLGKSSWVKSYGLLVIPDDPDITNMQPLWYVTGIPAGDAVYVDDVVLRDVTEAYYAQVDADAAQAQANTATTSAATAQGQADTATSAAATADGKAVAAQSAAATADGKAVVAQSAAATADGKAVAAQSAAATADAKAAAAQTLLDASVTSGANMIPDPSFENPALDAARALIYAYLPSTEQAHDGSRSLKYTYAGGYPSMNLTPSLRRATSSDKTYIPTTPGRTYYVSQWVYLKSPNAGSREVHLYCMTWDKNFTAPGYAVIAAFPALDQWVKMDGYLTITDADAAYLVPLFGAIRPGNDIGAVIYLDECVLIDVTDAFNAQLDADAAQAQANTATANAATAQGQADTATTAAATADDKAVAAQGAAATADGKAVVAKSLAQGQIGTGSNLATNPSFEDTNFYQNGSFTTEQARTGSRSLKLVGTGVSYPGVNVVSNDVAAIPVKVKVGDILSFSAWVYGKSTNTQTSGGTNGIRLAGDAKTVTGATAGTFGVYATASTALNGVWTKVSGIFNFYHAETDYIYLYIQINPAVNAGETYYFDDVEIHNITEAYYAQLDADAAQAQANTATANAATAQGQANTATTNAATAQTTADTARTTVEAVAASGSNMVISPNFEDPAINRITYSSATYATYEYTTEDKLFGTRSFKWTIVGSAWNGPYLAPSQTNTIHSVKPGESYSVQTRVKAKSTNTVDSNTVILFMRWSSSAGAALGDNTVAVSGTTLATAGWYELNRVATCPDNADRLQVFVLSHPSMPVGNSFYLDAVSVREQTVAGNALAAADTAQDAADAADAKAVAAQTLLDQRIKNGANVATNPEYSDETFAIGSPGAFTFSTDRFRAGVRSAKRVADGAYKNLYFFPAKGAGALYQICSPGQVFWLEAYVFGHESNNQVQSNGFWLGAYGNNGATVFAATPNVEVGPTQIGKGSWYKISGYIEIPASNTNWTPVIAMRESIAANEIYYFDSLLVVEVTEAYAAKAAAEAAQAQANTATTNAATAQGTANTATTAAATADGKAVAAQSAAATADGKAVVAQGAAATADGKAVAAQSTATAGQNLAKATVAAGVNLATDGNFENTSIAIAGTNAVRSSERANNGTYSVKITQPGNYYGFIYPVTDGTGSAGYTIPAAEGDKFYVECMVYGEAANQDAPGKNLWIQSTVKRTTGNSNAGAGYVTADASRGVWTKQSGYMVMPADTYEVLFYWVSHHELPAGNVYFVDAFKIYRVTEAYDAQIDADAAAAQANTATTNAATAQVQADTATTNAATADAKAVVAQNALSTAINAGANLCANGSCENTDYKLSGYNVSYSTEFKRSGSRSLKLVGLTGANIDVHFFSSTASYLMTLPVQEGDVLYFEAWIRGGAGNTKVGGGIRPYLLTGDPANPSWTYPADINNYTGTLANLNASWQKVSGYYTVPAGGIGLQVVVQLHTSAGTGCILHVDDMVCYRVTEGYVADTKAVAAQAQANTAKANADTAQGAADTAQDAADAADGKAVTAQSTADKAKSLTKSVLSSGSNIFANPSFENTDFFINATANRSYSSDVARSGTKSIKQIGYNYWYLFSDDTSYIWAPCVAGDWVYVEAYIYGHANNVDTTFNTYIQVCWINAAGVQTSCTNATGWTPYGSAFNGVWTKISGVVQAPAGAVGFNPVPVQSSGGTPQTNTYYWDDVDVRIITEAYNAQLDADAAQAQANTATTNAATAQGTANTATTAAATADAKAVVAKSLSSTAITAGSNLVSDPLCLNNNMYQSSMYSSDVSYGGTKSIKTTGTQSKYLTVDDVGVIDIPCVPGDVFYIEMWVYGKTTNTLTAGLLYLSVVMYNAAKTWPPQYGNTPWVFANPSRNGVWTKASAYVTVPSGASYIRAVAVADSVAAGEVYYFSDCKVYRVTEAQAAQLDADAAQAQANTATTNAATAQGQANTATTNAATADGKAVAAQATADIVTDAVWLSAQSGNNLIPNPSFESSQYPVSYTVFTTEDAHTGTQCLKVTHDGTNYRYPQPCVGADGVYKIKVRPNQVFYWEFWAKGHSSNTVYTGGTEACSFGFWQYHANGDWYGTSRVVQTFDQLGRGSWVKFSGIYTVPNMATMGQILVLCHMPPVANGTVVYLDDFVLRDITEAYNAQLDADAAQADASTGITNAATADGKAVTADSKAVAAQSTADAAVTKTTYDAFISGGANMATNPSFEDTTQHMWNGSEFSTAVAHSGTRSAKLTANGADKYVTFCSTATSPVALLYPACSPGQVFYIEFWMYQTGGTTNNVSDQSTQVLIQFFQDSTYKTAVSTAYLGSSTAHNNVWTKVFGTFTVPAGVHNRMRVLLRMHNNTSIGTVRYYDDVVLRDITEAYNAQQDADAADGKAVAINQALYNAPTPGAAILAEKIPDLQASKITTGNFAQNRIDGLPTKLVDIEGKADDADDKAVAAQDTATTARNAVDNSFRYGSNLCTNPGAEDTTLPIASYNGLISYSTDYARNGSRSIKFIAGNADNYSYYLFGNTSTFNVWMPCSEGDVFSFEAYVRGVEGNPNNFPPYIRLTVKKNIAGSISYEYPSTGYGIDGLRGETLYSATQLNNGWCKITGVWTAPAGAVEFQSYLQVHVSVPAGNTYYADDIKCYRVTEGYVADGKAVAINQALYNAPTPGPAVLAENIADLQASKITSGTFDAGRIADGSITGVKTANLDASKLTVGTAAQDRITGLPTDLEDQRQVTRGYINSGDNLLPNPGFESLSFVGNSWFISGQGRSGSRALKMTGNGVNYIAHSPVCDSKGSYRMPTRPGDKFYFEVWYRGDPGNPAHSSSIFMQATSFNTAGSATGYPGVHTAVSQLDNSASVWKKLSGIVTIPANTVDTSFQLYLNLSMPSGVSYYFDDMVLKRVTDTAEINQALYALDTPGSAVLAEKLPDLQASKITSGEFFEDLIPQLTQSKVAGLPTDLSVEQTLISQSNAIIALQGDQDASSVQGKTINIDFSTYADGALPATWSVIYSGSGTSTIGVANDSAGWIPSGSADVSARLIYLGQSGVDDEKTLTDFQKIRGTITSIPALGPNSTTAGPKFWALGRVSDDGNTYVFARAGFANNSYGSLTGQLGCVIGGDEQIWLPNITLNFSLQMSLVCGVEGDERTYEIYSGGVKVAEYTETGVQSRLCSANHQYSSQHTTSCVPHRRWGAITEIKWQLRPASRTNPAYYALVDGGKVGSVVVTDNITPLYNGSVARLYRSNGSSGFDITTSEALLEDAFWNENEFESLDIDGKTSDGSFTVGKSKMYMVSARIQMTNRIVGNACLTLHRSVNGGSSYTLVQRGQTLWGADTGFQATNPTSGFAIHATWIQYLNEGDKIRLGAVVDRNSATNIFTGTSSAETYFTISALQ